MITSAYLKERLIYIPYTGEFMWKERFDIKNIRIRNLWNSQFADMVAGCLDPEGYILIGINNIGYRAARHALLYMIGEWPPKGFKIDHKDTNRSNNRWNNLRLATNRQNSANSGLRKNNTSGYKNVTYSGRLHKYIARCRINGIRTHIGCFVTAEEASAAVHAVLQKQDGEFFKVA